MPGILNYDLAQYQESARTYRPDLLRLPILALATALQYMTLRPGVTYSEVVGAANIDAELRPYVRNAVSDADLELVLRELKTYFGTVNQEFDPNAAISTLLGHRAAQASGEALSTTPQAHEVIALVPKAIGYKLLLSLFNAKRNPTGKTTKDLFDGFDTIALQEIAAGNISAAKKNYVKLSAAPTKNNILDLCRDEILPAMSSELRGQEAIMYVPQSFLDDYNYAYKMETGAVIYNQAYDQTFVEGSQGRLRIVPFVGKADSKLIQITTRENMLVGVDQLSNQESVRVGNYSPDTFMVMLRMFFGCQYESIDPRRLLVAQFD